MIEKRFDYTAYDDGTESIYDREKDEYYFDMQLSNIEELLNDLADENEQLKKDCTTLIYHNQEYRKENQEMSNIISAIEKGSCRSIDSFLDDYCTDEILKEFDLE